MFPPRYRLFAAGHRPHQEEEGDEPIRREYPMYFDLNAFGRRFSFVASILVVASVTAGSVVAFLSIVPAI